MTSREQYRTRQYRSTLDKAGLKLHKSRIRDKSNELYGTYTIERISDGATISVFDKPYVEDLDEIEAFIKDVVEPMLLEKNR